MKNIFLVSFQEPLANNWKQYANQVLDDGDVYVMSPYVLIVSLTTSDSELLMRAFNLSQKADPPVVGAVFKLEGSYAGYYDVDLWQWLAAAKGGEYVPA